jgi:hypothetical protein
VSTSVRGHVECQLQTAPNAQLIKRVAQVIFDDLLSGADDIGNFAIGLAFSNQHGDLNFLGGQPITWLHNSLCSL